MTVDPVCKMKLEPEKAAAKAEHGGQTYYFCSDTCHKSFMADPHKYASGAAPADHSCCGGKQ
jgi:YHS domain-containing protein